MADLHPEVEKEIEAGPQEVPIVAYRGGTGFPEKRETTEEFARRIAALQQEISERENAALRAELERVRKDAKRWRYWRMYWPALCRMEVSRFARIDLSRKFVQSPQDMDEVTDAAIAQGKGEK